MHARNPAVPISARIILILVAIIIAAVVSAAALLGIDLTSIAGIDPGATFAFVATAIAVAAAADKARYYTRNEAIEYLRGRGVPITKSTMSKLCALGQGPKARARWSQSLLYLAADLDTWAESFIQSVPAKVDLAPTPSDATT